MDDAFEHTIVPLTSITSGEGLTLVHDVFCLTVQIVNVIFLGDPRDDAGWILVDAGMPHSATHIIDAAEKRFGKVAPHGIVLTHGHFDHVGAIHDLLAYWDVPVYAHDLELPFLTGQMDYPPADIGAGGILSVMSGLFPHHGIDLGRSVHALPPHGKIPHMPEWAWVHTPGHTPGHVSLFREMDGSLIAGDAFVSVKQESLYHVIVQDRELHGPPAYFTMDWQAACASVRRLDALQPAFAITGHGRPIHGYELKHGLHQLAETFMQTELPKHFQ